MNSHHFDNEIGDDEIRIVSSLSHHYRNNRSQEDGSEKDGINTSLLCLTSAKNKNEAYSKRGKVKGLYFIIGGIAISAIILLALGAWLFLREDSPEDMGELFIEEVTEQSPNDAAIVVVSDSIPDAQLDSTVVEPEVLKHFTTRKDTLINKVRLVILTPHNAIPELQLIDEFRKDSTVVLAVQAADIRRDNLEIVGAYVKKGELMSKGESKSGFCSIINGQITLGAADASPMLEQALMTEGYFFRQYPLVVGSQLVENKPKGRSIRRALVELNGNISVVISQHKLTYHEFSQSLIDLGVRNAISLVGGDALVAYVEENGQKFVSKDVSNYKYEYINYIVWK